MKRKIIYILAVLISPTVYSQRNLDDIQGVWIIYDFKGSNGKDEYNFMMDWVAQQFINDTLYLNSKIVFKHNKKTIDKNNHDACENFLPKFDCEYSLINKKKVKNINDYLFDTFGLRPIQVGLDKTNNNEIIVFHTNCKDEYYKEIYLISNKEELWIHNYGIIFRLKMAKK